MEIIKVKGMMCEGCERRIENALSEIKDIKNVEANHKDGIVKIECDGKLDYSKIVAQIEDLGFEVE